MKIKGTEGETEEMPCEANFDVTGEDVECTVSSSQNIGTYKCIVWRTTTGDGWNFDQVSLKLKGLPLHLFFKHRQFIEITDSS